MSTKFGHRTHNWFESIVNRIGGEDRAEAFVRGELKLVPRDLSDLIRPLGESVVCSAVTRFVANDAFTKTNGIVDMDYNFKQFILPVVEENVPEATIQVHVLTRGAKDLRIAAELNVDERGEVALTHFFQVLQRRLLGNRWIVAYTIGTDGNTWSVFAYLTSGGWFVDASPLGGRNGWSAGRRFLSH